ncbi:C-type lectin domain family 4 member C-like [Littorina saxatilis]|uniref:C-type lectin domain-containing protein n=1 Tax=Littorina saxatilis TaxID=31220 RepID=A0AAN9GBW0_9CAEN
MDSLLHVQSSSCFQVISDIAVRKNWTDARDACDSEGGRLAVLDTKDKIDTVMDVMRDNPDFPLVSYHLGAHRPMDRWDTAWPNGKPDYIWLNGQPLDLNLTEPYWNVHDPNNWGNSQNVMILSNNQKRLWGDTAAVADGGYICEFSLI